MFKAHLRNETFLTTESNASRAENVGINVLEKDLQLLQQRVESWFIVNSNKMVISAEMMQKHEHFEKLVAIAKSRKDFIIYRARDSKSQ